jgi:hypothetical protein
MSAVFLPSQPMTIAAHNSQANAPADRVLLDEPGLVARAIGTLSLTFDLGGRAFDSVAAIRHSLAATESIRIRVGSVADMSSGVLLDTTAAPWSGAAPVGKAITYIALPGSYTAPFVRVDLVSSGANPVEVSRIIVGSRVEADGIDRGAQLAYASGSSVVDGDGWTTVGPQRSRINWQANVGNIARTYFYAKWAPFLNQVGKHEGFLFIPQTKSDALQHEAALVRLKEDAKIVDVTSDRNRVEMTLFEV